MPSHHYRSVSQIFYYYLQPFIYIFFLFLFFMCLSLKSRLLSVYLFDYQSMYLTVYLKPSVPYRNGYLNLLFSFYKSFTCISKMCLVVDTYLYFNYIYLCNVHPLFPFCLICYHFKKSFYF